MVNTVETSMTIPEQYRHELMQQQYEPRGIPGAESIQPVHPPTEIALEKSHTHPEVIHSMWQNSAHSVERTKDEPLRDVPAVPVSRTLHTVLLNEPPIARELGVVAETPLASEAEMHDKVVTETSENAPKLPRSEDLLVELNKEPEDIYDDFRQALLSFAEIMRPRDDVTELDKPSNGGEGSNDQLIMVELATLIAAQLAELKANDTDTMAVALKNVVGVLHGLALLEEQGADSELSELAQNKLRELSVEILTGLGIEPNEQNVMYFVRMVQHPQFMSALLTQHGMEGLDIEHNGTHEAKYYARLLGTANDDETLTRQALGMFTLLCAGLHTAKVAV